MAYWICSESGRAHPQKGPQKWQTNSHTPSRHKTLFFVGSYYKHPLWSEQGSFEKYGVGLPGTPYGDPLECCRATDTCCLDEGLHEARDLRIAERGDVRHGVLHTLLCCCGASCQVSEARAGSGWNLGVRSSWHSHHLCFSFPSDREGWSCFNSLASIGTKSGCRYLVFCNYLELCTAKPSPIPQALYWAGEFPEA